MKIESIMQNINIPSIKGQAENAAPVIARNPEPAEGQKQSQDRLGKGSAISKDEIATPLARNDRIKDKNKQVEMPKNSLFDLKAVFAIDRDKNVVIRFLDKKGEIVKQIPPEEYINMVKKFRESVENIFSKKV